MRGTHVVDGFAEGTCAALAGGAAAQAAIDKLEHPDAVHRMKYELGEAFNGAPRRVSGLVL